MPELGHLTLHVRDLERSRAFYVDVLGWRVRGPVGADGVALGTGRAPLELVLRQAAADAGPAVAPPAVGLGEVGLRVGDDLDDLRRMHDRLVAADVPVEGATDDGLIHSLHVVDPDGTPLALYVDAVPAEVWSRRHDLLHVPPRPLDL